MRTNRTVIRRSLGATLVAAGMATLATPPAFAQVRAQLAPMTSFTHDNFGGGRRYAYWPGFWGPSVPPAPPPNAVPLEWEVFIQNDAANADTFSFDINVRAGLNGNYFSLNCPPTFLPAGVDPVADVTCSESTNTLQIRNIDLGGCEETFVRFSVDPARNVAPTTYRVDACLGGTVTYGAGTTATITPLNDQVPNEGGDTCVYFNDMGDFLRNADVNQRYTVEDENGPPLVPGDTLLFKAFINLRYLDVRTPAETYLDEWHANIDTTDTPIALPLAIEFIEFTQKPLEAVGAVYEYNAVTRMIQIYDPGDCPATSCAVAMPTMTNSFTDIVEWRGRLSCSAANLVPQCHHPLLKMATSWGSMSFFGGDDWHAYEEAGDSTCATPTLPDLSTSAKSVEDGDKSGDAQPGELLTFSIDATNSTVCPGRYMSCACRATQVIINDTVDTTFLDPATINPLNGGVLTPPNQIRWTVPAVAPNGKPGSTQTVAFQARVRTTARNNDTICNTATITAAELTSTTQGGLSQCPSAPPVSVSVTPCIDVRVPPGPSLALSKSIAPVSTCYAVGSTITVSVTVTNVGGGAATNVIVRDTLDTRLCPGGICAVTNLSDSGTIVGRAISWPALASLAGNGGSKTYTFDLTIPKTIADGTTIPNTATTNSTEIPTSVASNVANIPVCAPVLGFTKVADKPVYNNSGTDRVTWTISLTNTGSVAATNLIVADTIDTTKVAIGSLVFNPNTGTLVGNTYTWPALASLAGGGAQTVDYTISGFVIGTAGTQVCNTGRVTWEQGVAELNSTPTTGTCSDISGTSGCVVASLTGITLVKGIKSGGNAVFSWTPLVSAPTEYHLNSVTAKTDVPPAASCPAATGSKRATCGAGVARDTQTTPNGTHTGAISDPAMLLYYQVYAACGGTGDLEGD